MLLVSCAGEKTEEIDISALQLIPKKEKKISPPQAEKVKNPVVNNLKPLLNNDQLRKNINIGKSNPFSSLESENNFKVENLKLTGFLSANNQQYALVNYMDKSGYLTSDSQGGISTNLLPDGAIVKQINPKNNTLLIVIDDQVYTILLD